MIVKSAEFIKSAVSLSQCPLLNLPEIAFAGRSNVGKSSLINTILNRKKLVKTSSTPGCTQLINFFNINEEFVFVDLPGYGYAKVPESVRKKWKPMVGSYLSSREDLKGVVLIMDIRRSPREDELNFISWLNLYELPNILVLTKIDKLSKNKHDIQKAAICEALSVSSSDVILFSAKSREGKDSLWESISKLIIN
ncbi:MAG: YihA family ribosome biogenesis GTP-binding protein [Desulfobacterales bacterium]|nr:YihA family ribosome biogenesis GTP-binding protein [Desulfobacterales bacterium]